MLNKTKKCFILICLSIAVLFVLMNLTAISFADEDGQPESEIALSEGEDISLTEIDAESEDEVLLSQLVANFTAYLKDEYGEDYEFYYNQIIDNWGSIEAYLLAFGGKLPEQLQTPWGMFVGWLGEYSVIWAPIFTVSILIVIAILGKKKLEILIGKLKTYIDNDIDDKLSPIITELNSQSKATVSLIHSQKTLLGNGDKFADTIKELSESEKELSSNE